MTSYWQRVRVYVFDRLQRGTSNEQTYLLLIATLIGLGGGLGAIGFRHLIFWIQTGFLAIASALNYLAIQEWIRFHSIWDIPFWIKLLLPALGGAIVGPLIYFFAREAKGHGVPEVMAAVALKRGVIRKRLVLFKALASALTIGSGGSAGREGPIVHIGSAWGSTVGQLLKASPDRMKIFVGCGAAAGVAATFNAPIAGMFFALEIILGDFTVGTLSAVAFSSVIATVVAQMFLGDELALRLPQVFSLVSPFEVFTYLFLGLLAGGAAVLFTQTLSASESAFDRVKLPEYVKPIFGGLLVGFLGIWFPYVFGIGYDSIDLVFTGKLTVAMMALLVAAKILATSITLGGGMSGGIFAPSLVIGSFLGGAYGSLVHQWFPEWTASSGAYALVAMGAVVAAATNAPITAMLILFEMSRNYQIILALILSCTAANVVARLLMKDSIYTIRHTKRGLNLHGGREQTVLQNLTVRQFMKTDHEPLPRWLPFDAVVKVLLSREETDFFVVDEADRLVGDINLHTVKDVLTEQGLNALVLADDLMLDHGDMVTPQTDMAAAMRLFTRRHVEVLPVVNNLQDKRFLGVMRRSDLIDAYNREVLRQSAMGVRYVRSEQQAAAENARGVPDMVELNPEQRTIEVPVGGELLGKTLAEMNVRARFGVNVVAVRERHSPSVMHTLVPNPDRPLQEGDILVCVGRLEALEAFGRAAAGKN